MFYLFVLKQAGERRAGERRDRVTDFAICVEADSKWPVFCDDRARIEEYLRSQGAGDQTLTAFRQTYDEYSRDLAP